MGNIILVDYKSSNHTSELRAKLETAWNMLHTKTEEIFDHPQQNQHATKKSAEIRDVYSKYNTPILIFLILELASNIRTTNSNSNNNHDDTGSCSIHRYQEYVQHAVNEVYEITTNVMRSTQNKYHFNRNFTRNWYVQPLGYYKGDFHLKHGLFSGMNWMLRASSRQHEEMLNQASSNLK